MKLCLIEDEANIARLIQYDLKQAGWDVRHLSDGEEARQYMMSEVFDMFIVDWMLPGVSGLDLVKQLRAHKVDAIILMLTAKEEEADILEAFDAGVDDYLKKPFSPRELVARVKAHAKRLQTPQRSHQSFGDLAVDANKHRVILNDTALECTKKEYDLLTYLIQNHDIVLTRDDILNHIWNFDYDGDTRIVDVHIFKLRHKLLTSQCEIAAVRGVGYVLQMKPKS
jgi:DNA-binding response OmpR family regulator